MFEVVFDLRIMKERYLRGDCLPYNTSEKLSDVAFSWDWNTQLEPSLEILLLLDK